MVASKHREEQVYPAVIKGLLRIDAAGRVWRKDRRAEHDTGHYYQVRVMRNKVRYHALAHRLVWLHFNEPIPGNLQINHKNGDKHDNRPSNLELATNSENVKHAIQVLDKGRHQDGEANSMSKLTQNDIREIRARREKGELLRVIAADYKVTYQTISKIARFNRWRGTT